MYKVFVDHTPVIFIDKKDKRDKKHQIKYAELPGTRTKLRKLINEASLKDPQYVLCDNVDWAFNDYFSNYRKIMAGGGIVQRKNMYLSIERNGLWDIPKGRIERKETIEKGAIREVEEECGIQDPKIERFITRTFHVYAYKGKKALKETHWFHMKYEGPKETNPELNEGITKAEWLTLDELLSIRGRTYGSINELLDVFEKSLTL
jgi:8-oxo-dGTP pyrophosphatase MutT (NUDIX family)